MKLDIILTAQEVYPQKVKGKTVIVIDVLRATSVMTTALANGAHQIIPVLYPEEAFALQKKIGKENVILGGERNAIPIEGFDFGNSPFSYPPEIIKDKTLIITTTNGTRAIINSRSASQLLIGSFLNDQAIIEAVKKQEEVVIVASGSNNLFTLEDSLCAGKIAHQLQGLVDTDLSDAAIAMAHLYEQNKNNLHALASQGQHFKRLKKLGATKDLEYCFQSNITKVIPTYTHEGTLVCL
ncbi:2-phosphosulfolactate phosphatase [Saccharicrinis fermentans]|uniref:Probable 2-phosphosulfolactate phosphatase n=1 Tax=Saccharicrinis fermentans DSM 9555 = JCM 21142 TaxID=869213 RepID=W7Y0S0_9BACT|nr:2-phosphosulfolactate phosphatase [Saccharicrinis fermentans]GAF04525.1 putative 2-phosphosulfolactate phosphatase [Saccharicrinis fermentans DSM 9555 = JCM 21142]